MNGDEKQFAPFCHIIYIIRCAYDRGILELSDSRESLLAPYGEKLRKVRKEEVSGIRVIGRGSSLIYVRREKGGG